MNLDKIQNIVVVMMENRSFDQMLGYLSIPPFNRANVDGLKSDQQWLSRFSNRDGGQLHQPFRSNDPYNLPEKFDPPHERSNIAKQMGPQQNGAWPMNGFVSALPKKSPFQDPYRRLVMGNFGSEEVPITHFFAENFAICDHWFSSLPAGTQPNRLMAMSGRSRIDTNQFPLPQQSLVYEWLTEHNVSWRVYHEGIPFFALMPWWIPDILFQNHFRNFNHFAKDLINRPPSELPQVIFVEPTYSDSPHHGSSTDDHAPSGVSDGQEFLMQVYNAVTASGKFWKNCLLIVTYDEHGGFFDHVSPPLVRTTPPSNASYDPIESLGVRVPAHIISPFVQKGFVFNGVLDHTSILKLLGEKFGSGSYSSEVDARQVGSVSDVLEDSAVIVPPPPAPPVDVYLSRRPPKPVGVVIPPQETALQKGFRGALKEMANRGATKEHPEFGDLIAVTGS